MQVEGEESESKEPQAKVSTSGPRVSRRESYRSSKGFKVKQTPTTLFTARGESEFPNKNPIAFSKSAFENEKKKTDKKIRPRFSRFAEKRMGCKPKRRRG